MPAIDRDLLSSTDFDDCRCAPGRGVGAGGSPYFLSACDVKGCEKGVGEHIAQDDDFAVVNNGRAGKSPLRARHHEKRRNHRTKVFFPQQLGFGIKTIKPFGAELSDDMLSICRWRGIAMRRFGM